MVECRKCGKEIDEGDVKKVAEWPFCPNCFSGLFNKRAETSGAAPVAEDSPDSRPAEHAAPMKCRACLKPIENGEYKTLGIWTYCPECYEDLTARPPVPEASPDDEDENQPPEAPEPPGEQIDYTQPVQCGGCGRTIPLGGGKPAGDHILCPDCYYELARRIQVHIRTDVAPEKDSRAEHDVSDVPVPSESEACASCGKKVAASRLKETNGFMICKACLTADPELALEIARDRHQKYLRRLKHQLNE